MNIEDEIGMLLVKFPKFRGTLRNRKIIENPCCNTAYTDGKIIGFSPRFFKKISESERVFTLAHEILHIHFRHLQRIKGRNREAWNFATDAIINDILIKAGLTPPEGVIIVEGADKYSADELYEALITDSPSLPQEIKEQFKNMSDDQVKHLEDTHNSWKDFIEKNQDDEKEVDERDFSKENDEMKKEMRKRFSEENARASLGEKGNSKELKVGDIGEEPTQLVNWKTMLRNHSKRRKKLPSGNYEIEKGIFKERIERQKTKDMPISEIILDTSGSIDHKLLRGFLKECKVILKDSRIRVGCFDSEFYGFQDIKSREDLSNIKLRGGGLTDLVLASTSFSKEAKNKIIFTDGFGDEPKEAKDVMWIVFGNKHFKVPKGSRAVFVDPSELDEMRANIEVIDDATR